MSGMADTSLAVYRDVIVPTLGRREQMVSSWIAFAIRHAGAPTAMELVDRMRSAGVIRDGNEVKPRICDLAKRGVLVRGEKRKCRITGRTAYTWSLA